MGFPLGPLAIQALRAGLFVFVLGLALIHHLFQKNFLSWELYRNFYAVAALGMVFPLLSLFSVEGFFRRRWLVALSFAWDVLLVSVLLFTSQLNQSVFLFLYLALIILSGLVFQIRGALAVALWCSILSTLVLVLGDELKSIGFFFLLLLNNIAFFSVAWISGFLAEQLESQGLNISDLRRINESMIETLPMGLATVDENGAILKANRELDAILGDRVFEKIFDYFPQGELSPWPFTGAREVRTKIGAEEKNLLVHVYPQVLMSKKSYLVVIEDRTQLERLEYAVRQSEKLAAVGQLAAGIAHEIRNPLAGISGSIELLSQQSQGEDDRKLTRIILKEIDRLNNLISEFLDFAKPEKPPAEKVDVSALLNEICDQVRLNPQLKQDVEQRRETPPGLFIKGHRDKLKQAFLNMVINSYQALQQVPYAQLKVMTSLEGSRVRVQISDNGVGMDETTRKRMFEPFMTTKPKGTGLGLAITQKILENHAAQIYVSSEVGKGTTISLEFPVMADVAPPLVGSGA